MLNFNKNKKQKGAIMVLVIVFTAIFFTLIAGILSLIVYQKKLYKIRYAKESAFQIAEAGIEYYRWHLAHNNSDYTDGVGGNCNPCGPYNHIYNDYAGNPIGTFSLIITPPATAGSTLTTINSTGWLTSNPNQKKIIEIKYERLPFTRYAILSNSYLKMPTSAITNGPVHSNKGVRFDGLAYNLVTSTLTQDNGDTGVMEYGVHTHKTTDDPLPPSALPARPDVFVAGRSFPAPEVDFIAINTILDGLLTIADNDTSCGISNKCIIPESDEKGWHIQLLNNDKFKYRKIERVKPNCKPNPMGTDEYQSGTIDDSPCSGPSCNGSWSSDKPLPTDGIIFIKDNVWVDGILGANNRVTIVAAKTEDPDSITMTTGGANIWINNNLTYATTNGTEAIGLIAQNNISVGLESANDLIINGALIAKNGRIGRDNYHGGSSNCGGTTYNTRNSITIKGSLITNQNYGFLHIGSSSGYQTQNIDYDSYLYASPPPHFPAEADFSITSWEEK